MTTEDRFSKRPNLVTRSIAGETIIIPISGDVADLESIYTLNETATSVWNRIDGRASVQELVDAVCGEFSTSPEEVASDVSELLKSMLEAGLIQPATL